MTTPPKKDPAPTLMRMALGLLDRDGRALAAAFLSQAIDALEPAEHDDGAAAKSTGSLGEPARPLRTPDVAAGSPEPDPKDAGRARNA